MTDRVVRARPRVRDVGCQASFSSLCRSPMNSVEHIIRTQVALLTAQHQALCEATQTALLSEDDGTPAPKIDNVRGDKAEIETLIRSKGMLLKLITSKRLSLNSPQLSSINWSSQDLDMLLQMNESLVHELDNERSEKEELQRDLCCAAEQLELESRSLKESQARLMQQDIQISQLNAVAHQVAILVRQMEKEKGRNAELQSQLESLQAGPGGRTKTEKDLVVFPGQEMFPAKVDNKNIIVSLLVCVSVLAVPVLCPVIVLLSPFLAPMVVSYFFLRYRLQLSFFSVAFHFQWSMMVPDINWCRKTSAGPSWSLVPSP